MNFQLCSDLHTEFLHTQTLERNGVLVPNLGDSNVMFLAGDIGVPCEKTYESTISFYSQNYEHVVVVMGNHEYYKQHFDHTKKIARQVCCKYANVRLLDNEWTELCGYSVFGGTLWTSIPSTHEHEIKSLMNDYTNIRYKKFAFTPLHCTTLHLECVKALRDGLKDRKKVIVVTHHPPSFKCLCDPIHSSVIDPNVSNPNVSNPSVSNPSVIDHAYASDLEYLVEPRIEYWIHGHLHQSKKVVINGTTIISNPRGYPSESVEETQFNKKLVVKCF